MGTKIKIKENERMEDKMVDLVLCTKDPQVRIIWNLRPRIIIPFWRFTAYKFTVFLTINHKMVSYRNCHTVTMR